MPKQNKQHNAYYYFVQTFIQNKKREGITYKDFNVASPHASILWQKLSNEERQAYKTAAKNSSLEVKNERYTSRGVPLSIVIRQQEELIALQEEMIDDIKRMVNVGHDELASKNFFLVHMCFYYTSNSCIVPAELGFCVFNLRDGIRNYYHAIINAGRLPLGSAFDVQNHSKRTHGIPEDYADGYSDFDEPLSHIIDMLQMYSTDDKYVLFTAQDNVLLNYDFANTARYFSMIDIGAPTYLYPLHELLFNLRNACQPESLPSSSFASSEICSYSHTKGRSCEYHDEIDNKEYCSLSVVTSWAFLFCDHCCGLLDIELKPGSHKPGKPEESVVRPVMFSRSDDLNCDEIPGSSNGLYGHYNNSYTSFAGPSSANASASTRGGQRNKVIGRAEQDDLVINRGHGRGTDDKTQVEAQPIGIRGGRRIRGAGRGQRGTCRRDHS